MKPRWMSEWMAPAASRAVSPARMGQARTSSLPAVRKLMSPSCAKAAWATTSAAGPGSPRAAAYSCLLLDGEPGHLERVGERKGHHVPVARPAAPSAAGSQPTLPSDSVFTTSSCGVSVRNWYPRMKASCVLVEVHLAQRGLGLQRLLAAGQGLLAGVGHRRLLGPLESPLDADQVGQQELPVQLVEVASGWAGSPSMALSKARSTCR